MISDLVRLQRAHGYCGLGMYDAALNELDAVGDSCRHRPEYRFVRMRVYRESCNWEEVIAYADELNRSSLYGGCSDIWNFDKAYAIYKLEGPRAALRLLLNLANPSEEESKSCHFLDRKEASSFYSELLKENHWYHYELARFHCLGRDFSAARRSLGKAVRIDKKTTCERLLEDEDFDDLWAQTGNAGRAKDYVRAALLLECTLDLIGEREGKGWEEYLAAEKAFKESKG